jgi:hypothetical protein
MYDVVFYDKHLQVIKGHGMIKAWSLRLLVLRRKEIIRMLLKSAFIYA